MSVVIINVSTPDERRSGLCRYQVRMNLRTIVEFQHRCDDGLAVCLNKAAAAVRAIEPKDDTKNTVAKLD